MARPIRVSLVNDYEVVVAGLNQMFAHYGDRIKVVKLLANERVREPVDIVLYDSFGQNEPEVDVVKPMLDNPLIGKVVIYTWSITPQLLEDVKKNPISGCLSKTLSAHQLVQALEEIHAGRKLVMPAVPNPTPVGSHWPGREEGLSYREAEMIALITRGFSNEEIAKALYLSTNTVKSYIRIAYRKIGVKRRAQAVAWGIAHGFSAESVRIPAPTPPN